MAIPPSPLFQMTYNMGQKRAAELGKEWILFPSCGYTEEK